MEDIVYHTESGDKRGINEFVYIAEIQQLPTCYCDDDDDDAVIKMGDTRMLEQGGKVHKRWILSHVPIFSLMTLHGIFC